MLFVIATLITLCFPVVVIAPITALGYMRLIKSNNLWLLFPFAGILIFAYLISFQMIILGWGHAFPGPGFGAYTTLPYIAAITVIIGVAVGRKNWKTLSMSTQEKIGYSIGAIFVLAFQLSAQFWFRVITPFLLSEWAVCSWLTQIGLSCW